MRYWLPAVFVVAAGGCHRPAPAPAPDWVLEAGRRAGPITASSSLSDLRAIYGPSIRPGPVPLGEGETAPGAVLFPDDSSRRLQIVWQDTAGSAPRSVTITGDASVWHTYEGITLGTSLGTLEHLNGGPFRLTGFGWDYSGTVTDWMGGKLARRFGKDLVLRLAPADGTDSAAALVQGDTLFSSAYPPMRAAAPRVYQLVMTFDSTPPRP